jgi:hypothetical protein
MTDYGTVQIGRLALREAHTVAADTANASGRPLAISGQEAVPVLTAAQLARAHDDLLAMVGSLVPVTFTHKNDRDGYYVVVDASAELTSWSGELVTCSWKTSLARLGTGTDLDLESRLSGGLARNNAYTATGGERWHCPAADHFAYWTSSITPSTVTRTGEDGALIVYRALPLDVHPRWGCDPGDYLGGRSRFLDGDGLERSGLPGRLAATGWELANSLVRVRPSTGSGVLEVSTYSGGQWQAAKAWDVLLGGVSLGASPAAVTLLHNQPELVVLRLTWARSPGRVSVDLTLRRGARVVELYVQTGAAATLKVVLAAAEAGTSTAGYVVASSDDPAGDRYLVGSTRAVTADTINGGVSLAATTSLDAFVGAVVGGSGAAAGDTAAALWAQYLGTPAESVQGVLR